MTARDSRGVLTAAMVVIVGLLGEFAQAPVYLVAGIVLTGAVMALVADPRVRFRFTEWTWWGLIAWGVIAAFAASGTFGASKATLAGWAAAGIVFSVVSRAGIAGHRISVILLAGGAVVLDLSIIGNVFGGPGLIANPNVATAMILASIGTLFTVEILPGRWLIFGLSTAAVFLTGSRAGFAGLVLIGFLVAPAGRSRRVLTWISAVAVVLFVAWRVVMRPESLAWFRFRIWEAVAAAVLDHPVWGIGAGAVGAAMGPYRVEHLAEIGRWGHVIGGAENMILGLVLRVGLPGLAPLLFLGAALWRRMKSGSSPALRYVLGGMAAMALFHDFWSEPAVLWWWAAATALVIGVPEDSSSPVPTGIGFGRLLLVLASGGLIAWALVQPAWAQWYWESAGEPTFVRVDSTQRVEPWFAGPPERRIETLLMLNSWSWDQACEAIDRADHLVRIEKGAASAWNLRASVSARVVLEFGAWRGTVHRARASWRRAMDLEPRLPWYPYRQALFERELGNLDEARFLAKRAIETEPAFVRGWLLLARLELDSGDIDAARRACARSVTALNSERGRADRGYDRDLIECPTETLEELRGILGNPFITSGGRETAETDFAKVER